MKSSTVGKNLATLAVIAMVAALALALTACGSGNNDSKKFVGTWANTYEQTANDGLTYNVSYALAINEDGTWRMELKQTGRILGTNYGGETRNGTWKASGDTASLVRSDVADTTYRFKISSDGTTIRDTSTEQEFILHKQNG